MNRRPMPQTKPIAVANPRLKSVGFFDSQQIRSDIYRIHRLYEHHDSFPRLSESTRAALGELHKLTGEVKTHRTYIGDPHIGVCRRWEAMMVELEDRIYGESWDDELAALCEEFVTALGAYLAKMAEWRQRYLRRPSE